MPPADGRSAADRDDVHGQRRRAVQAGRRAGPGCCRRCRSRIGRPSGAHRGVLDRGGRADAKREQTWEGQADVATLPGNRFVLTWGVRSVKESLDEVRALCRPARSVLDMQAARALVPRRHLPGRDDARAAATRCCWRSPARSSIATLPELRNFVGDKVEVLAGRRGRRLGYACNSLCVNGTVLMPSGLSTALRGHLVRRGFSSRSSSSASCSARAAAGRAAWSTSCAASCCTDGRARLRVAARCAARAGRALSRERVSAQRKSAVARRRARSGAST